MRPVIGDALGLDPHRPRTRDLRALEAIIEQQRAVIDCLKAALAADSPALQLAQTNPDLLAMSRQERALTAALVAASPRAVSLGSLLDLLPGHDHAHDRDINLVRVIVSRVRAHLGKDAILTLNGHGYFMPQAARDRLLSGS